MPYIKPKCRLWLDSDIDDIVHTMRELDGEHVVSPGLVNYVITSIVVRSTCPESGCWSYSSLSKALAVFRDAEAEMRRRLLDPYEDKAIQKNGDIPEYESTS